MQMVAGVPRGEYNRKYLNDRYADQKRIMFEYLGGVCVVCGTDDELEIDHRDWCKKTRTAARLWPWKRYEEMFAELDQCQLLCSDHHLQKSKADWLEQNALKDFTHGTIYGYVKRACRCEVCIAGHREYNAIRRARRRAIEPRGPRGEYGRPATHGEILMYRRGCKCEACRAANSAYARKLQQKAA